MFQYLSLFQDLSLLELRLILISYYWYQEHRFIDILIEVNRKLVCKLTRNNAIFWSAVTGRKSVISFHSKTFRWKFRNFWRTSIYSFFCNFLIFTIDKFLTNSKLTEFNWNYMFKKYFHLDFFQISNLILESIRILY